jgi:hypothetical protein
MLNTLKCHINDNFQEVDEVNIFDQEEYKDKYMVYILSVIKNDEERAIVAGHGKKNRAKIIFDNTQCTTAGHVKAMLVRLYHLYYQADSYKRYIIKCDSKDDARNIEKEVHKHVQGNTNKLPDDIKKELLDLKKIDCGNLKDIVSLILNIALESSYDGLEDLNKWNNKKILDPKVWEIITDKLSLNLE